jgi:hypothetical protein
MVLSGWYMILSGASCSAALQDGGLCCVCGSKAMRGQHKVIQTAIEELGVEYAQAGQACHSVPGGGKEAAEGVVVQRPA